MHMYYFDYAAATPLSRKVLKAMEPYLSDKFYNPSALYIASQDVKNAIYSARSEVASILGCKSSEIIFTAGGTESDNLAIRGVMEAFPDANCVVSAVEHEAVLAPSGLYKQRILPVGADGRVELIRLEGLIDDGTVLVSIMYANNETGTIQPIGEVSKILNRIRSDRKARGISTPIYLHTDACQAANYLSLLVNSLGVDLMTLNGGKIYGPKQSGILYVKTGVQLSPQILGGGQERGLRSGTENVPAIIGFAEALQEAASMKDQESSRLYGLQQEFIAEISEKIPSILFNGSLKHRLPNNIHITLPGTDNERLMMELDERGIMVATGSACSASSDEPSHVLKAMGIPDKDARSSLRITFGRQTDKESITKLIQSLSEITG